MISYTTVMPIFFPFALDNKLVLFIRRFYYFWLPYFSISKIDKSLLFLAFIFFLLFQLEHSFQEV